LIIKLKTAKVFGLTVLPSLIDEVIECSCCCTA
jgi:hypothetical protein